MYQEGEMKNLTCLKVGRLRSDDGRLTKRLVKAVRSNAICSELLKIPSESWHIESRDSPSSSIRYPFRDVNSLLHLLDTWVVGLRAQVTSLKGLLCIKGEINIFKSISCSVERDTES